VRKREDDDVVPVQRFGRGRFQHPVGQGADVGLVPAERLSRVGVRRDGADLDLGMGREQAQHLAAGVSAGAGDCYPNWHVHEYTPDCMIR